MQTPSSADPTSLVPAADGATPALTLNEPVSLIVHTHTGEEIAVEVAQVPLSKMGRYAETLPDISAFVEFVTGQPVGFAEKLRFEDLFRVDEAAQARNTARFTRYLKRQVEVTAWLERTVKAANAAA